MVGFFYGYDGPHLIEDSVGIPPSGNTTKISSILNPGTMSVCVGSLNVVSQKTVMRRMRSKSSPKDQGSSMSR
jgi:hypothetical protein